MTITVAVLAGLLYAVGTWLVLQRRLTRIIIGLGIMAHGANLLLLQAGGNRGQAPFVGDGTPSPADTADPLPQALALTAIVITFGVTAFLLALGYRSWVLTRDDLVEDDLEDRRIARSKGRDRAVADQAVADAERADAERADEEAGP